MRIRYSFGSRHTGNLLNIAKQRVKYPAVMKQVMEISDIILQILDARYVNEMRNIGVENDIKNMGKKTVFVLNKSDLVNVREIEKTLPVDLKPYVFVSTKTRAGAKELRDRIKIEAKRVDIGEKQRVHVGVIGYPNAGKSSIINLITRKGIAKISKQAGFTKGMQKIKMAEGILIIDTPGVIPQDEYTTDKKSLISRDAMVGARTASDVKNPELAVHNLMKIHSAVIEKFYGIEANGDSELLIEEVGKKKNLLMKGGAADIDRSSRVILKDWQEGKIRA